MKKFFLLTILTTLPLLADGPLRLGILNQGGATDTQVLCWSTANDVWQPCDAASGGSSINVEEDNVEVISSANLTGIDFLGADFDVTDDGNEADVAVASGITRDTEWDSVAEIETATSANIITDAEIDSEAELEALLAGVTNVFTNNDGALADDDLSDDAITALSDVTAKSGTGTTVLMQGSPTITTPTIASFANAAHNHEDAAGGGTLGDAAVADTITASNYLPLAGGTVTGVVNVDEANFNLRDAEDDTQLQLIAGALNLFDSNGVTQLFRIDAGGLSYGNGLTLDFSSTSAWNGSVDVRLVNNSGALNMSVGSGYQVGGVDVLTVAGGTLTGALVADAQGLEFEESDDVVTCAAGDYWIRADLSETTLKKCLNGTETVLDTTGGSPAFSDITGATNTTAAMVVGTGASLTVSGSGTINATSLSSTAIADFLLEAELDTIAELQAQIADATILTTADEGTGNGIDADTVDGVEESAFLLIDGSRAMTGALVTDNLGIDITDSDTNPTCSAGEYKIYADTSEATLKKCINGTASNLDTTGGTPAFSDITGATNTSAAMVVGTGASLTVSGSGTINATSLSGTALADFLLETELDTIAELQSQIADATLLTTADEGSGNGIDADTLDGSEGSAYTLDTEWDTAAEINAATSDDDFVTLTGSQTISGDKTFSGTTTFSGTGPALAITEQSAPGAGSSAGVHNVYIDSADSLLKSHENGGSVVTYARTADNLSAFAATTSSQLLGVLSDETGSGVAVFGTSPTIATPVLTGKIDRNNVSVDDDDCTGEQGLWWYDTTDSQFEFCNANSGTPVTLSDFQGVVIAFDPRADGMLLDDTSGNETCVLDLEKHTTGAPDIYKWHCAFNDDDNIQFSGVTPTGSWSTITARVGWHDDDTSCDVDWAVSVWSADDGDTATGGSFDTVNTIDDAASPGANQIDYAEVTVSNDDTLGAEEGFVVNISFIDDAGSSCSDNADFADTIKLDYFALIFE